MRSFYDDAVAWPDSLRGRHVRGTLQHAIPASVTTVGNMAYPFSLYIPVGPAYRRGVSPDAA
jgi:hypothetical protein